MPSEFELIERCFARGARRARLGIGDDAALIDLAQGRSLALSVDTLNEGVHFLAGADPEKLGHKALAVNLSDLAAMGASPRYALLALTLPAAETAWVEAFAAGFFALAEHYDVELIGGDTTRGPRSITITALGEVVLPALCRDGAKPGDDIWVSGELGGAALGLACLQGEASVAKDARADMVRRLEAPSPRVELGLALRGLASAAIDLSDGLTGDLGHVLECSGVAGRIDYASVPRPRAFASVESQLQRRLVLGGGDDYELLFTASPESRQAVAAIGARLALPLTRVGVIQAGAPQLLIVGPDGAPMSDVRSHDHFL